MQEVKTIENNQSDIEQKILDLLPLISYSELKGVVGGNNIQQWINFCWENDYVHKKEKEYSNVIKSLIKKDAYRIKQYRTSLKKFKWVKKNHFNLPYYDAYALERNKYLQVLVERDNYSYSQRVLLKQELKEYDNFLKEINLIKSKLEEVINEKKDMLTKSQIRKIRKTLNNLIFRNRNNIQNKCLANYIISMTNKQIDSFQKTERRFDNLRSTIEQLIQQKASIEKKIQEIMEQKTLLERKIQEKMKQKTLLLKKNQQRQEQAFIWVIIGDALKSLFSSDFSDVSKN